MKILHVITDMDPKMGGVSQAVQTMVGGLTTLGDSNEVVSLNDPHEQFIGDSLFTVHALGRPKGPWAYSNKLLPWLLKNIERFDTIIVHGIWQYHSYGVAKAFRKCFKANGATFHGSCPRYFVMPHGMLDPY